MNVHVTAVPATVSPLLLSHIADAEAEPAHLILAQAYSLHYIAQLEHILDLVHSLLRDLGDVYQTFLARSELKECAEILKAMVNRKMALRMKRTQLVHRCETASLL